MHKPNSIFEAARQVLSEGSKPAINQKGVIAFQKAIDKLKWKPEKGDDPADTASMNKKYEDDRRVLKIVLDLYKEGKWEQAYKIVSKLDTSVREEIPAVIFDELAEA